MHGDINAIANGLQFAKVFNQTSYNPSIFAKNFPPRFCYTVSTHCYKHFMGELTKSTCYESARNRSLETRDHWNVECELNLNHSYAKCLYVPTKLEL